MKKIFFWGTLTFALIYFLVIFLSNSGYNALLYNPEIIDLFYVKCWDQYSIWNLHLGLLALYGSIILLLIAILYFYVNLSIQTQEFLLICYIFGLIFETIAYLDFLVVHIAPKAILLWGSWTSTFYILLMGSWFGFSLPVSLNLLGFFIGAILWLIFEVYPVSEEKILIIWLFGIQLLGALISLSGFIGMKKRLVKANLIGKLRHFQFFTIITLVSVIVPLSYLWIVHYFDFSFSPYWNIIYLFPSLMPLFIIFYSSHFGVLNYELPISKNLIRIIAYLGFTFIYWVAFGRNLYFIGKESKNLHLLVFILVILIIDPFRVFIYHIINRKFIERRLVLEKFLALTNQFINNPRNLSLFLKKFMDILYNSMAVENITLFFDKTLFKSWAIEPQLSFQFLPRMHPIWAAIRIWRTTSNQKVLNRSNLGQIRDILIKYEGILLIPLKQFSAFVMFGGKKIGGPFHSEDLAFLNKIISQVELLLINYQFLISDIQARKQENILESLASRFRKTIPEKFDSKNLSFRSVFSASQKVTGDYLDFIEIKKGEYFAVLGDVVGHGLGSSYLMSICRAILRGSILKKQNNLGQIFNTLNDFLLTKIDNNTFLSLFVMKLQIKSEVVAINYCNAGQHPAISFSLNTSKEVELKNSQPLLGVQYYDYQESLLTLSLPCRIFMYTDGAFEVFNKNEEILGESRLRKILKETLRLKLSESLKEVKNRIKNYNSSEEEMDDISIMAIEVLT